MCRFSLGSLILVMLLGGPVGAGLWWLRNCEPPHWTLVFAQFLIAALGGLLVIGCTLLGLMALVDSAALWLVRKWKN